MAKQLMRATESRIRDNVFTLRLMKAFFSLTVISAVCLAISTSACTGNNTAIGMKDGVTPEMDVRYRSFKGSAGQVTEPDLRLIGATQRAAFFYDLNDLDNEKDNRTVVISNAQIISIEIPDKE